MDKGQLYVFLAAAFFSLQPILLKFAALELPGLFTVSLRFFGTLIIFVPLSFKYRKQLKNGLREWKKFVLPTLFLTGAVLLFTLGVFLTDNATLTSLVTKSNVIFMTLMTAAFFVEERAILKSKRYLAGLVLATIGVIGVITGGTAITLTLGLGFLLLIVSQLSWSFFSVSMKRLINKQTRLSILCLIFPLGFLFSIPVGAVDVAAGLPPFNPLILLFPLASGVAMALGNVAQFRAIQSKGLLVTAAFQLSMPFMTGALGFLLFGEVLTLTQMAFAAVLIAGSYLIIRCNCDVTQID